LIKSSKDGKISPNEIDGSLRYAWRDSPPLELS
jgi:hypothetical protein